MGLSLASSLHGTGCSCISCSPSTPHQVVVAADGVQPLTGTPYSGQYTFRPHSGTAAGYIHGAIAEQLGVLGLRQVTALDNTQGDLAQAFGALAAQGLFHRGQLLSPQGDILGSARVIPASVHGLIANTRDRFIKISCVDRRMTAITMRNHLQQHITAGQPVQTYSVAGGGYALHMAQGTVQHDAANDTLSRALAEGRELAAVSIHAALGVPSPQHDSGCGMAGHMQRNDMAPECPAELLSTVRGLHLADGRTARVPLLIANTSALAGLTQGPLAINIAPEEGFAYVQALIRNRIAHV